MSDSHNDFGNRLSSIRKDAIAVLENLVEKGEAFELAHPPEALQRYRLKLVENSYTVLVVGEAKRGKSTFVNALIGDDLLPTDVENATSQVFAVRRAEREEYRLRYEDGSAREISRTDLPRYGTQGASDDAPLRLDRIIRWIEVDVPTRYIPEGVSILDTPGLGSLYAAHGEITQRFVPQADAVIYVLDSERPLQETDAEFIEMILGVTQNVFFIQTMIDRYGSDHWREIQRRNQEILADRFGERLPDTRVWPVSSNHLRDAITREQQGEHWYAERYLERSRHEELEAALRAFLDHVAFSSRSAEAMIVADDYYRSCRNTLLQRQSNLVEAKEKSNELRKSAAERSQEFAVEWGPQGQKYRSAVDEVRKAIAVSKQSFREALQPGGDIVVAQTAKIDALETVAEARIINESMPDEVVAQTISRWSRERELVEERCAEKLRSFMEDVALMEAKVAPDLGRPDLGRPELQSSPLSQKFKADYFKMLRSSLGGVAILSMAGRMLLPTMGLGPVALPLIAVLGLPMIWWGARSGLRDIKKQQLKEAQQHLHKNLNEVLQRVRRHFFSVDSEAERFSRVDEFFNAFERTFLHQIQTVAKQKYDEAQKEIDLLNHDANLRDQERRGAIERTRRQLAEWEEIGKAIEGVSAQLEELKESPALQGAG